MANFTKVHYKIFLRIIHDCTIFILRARGKRRSINDKTIKIIVGWAIKVNVRTVSFTDMYNPPFSVFVLMKWVRHVLREKGFKTIDFQITRGRKDKKWTFFKMYSLLWAVAKLPTENLEFLTLNGLENPKNFQYHSDWSPNFPFHRLRVVH